ncbi:DNA-processing protein DprA [Streptomyces sedi]|uniref:DNA-protecting protein DprA n=1 Tax=Streptomyces sedi TaxID=555059 RepID=A0A5C4UWM1_9ACTN|nr:DNA-processing protein DprA [Streptomyces sedi]TNM27319.1 DNA-protecting protein DprA [Streptomyces sedi]
MAPGERLARAALAGVVEPGDERLGRLIAAWGPEPVWVALRKGAPPPEGVSARHWSGLCLRAEKADPERDLERIGALGGRFLCPGDREWPGQLADLGAAAPIGLWVRGPCSLRFVGLRAVALVGARACTDYGAHVAAELATGLAERGWTVVSGAAFGIDGAAHRGALAVSGVTVAVLACGVDVSYPLAHRELLDRIAGSGLVVAELAPGDHPTRGRFIQRNRVIAALSRGTVVVEAARRSGALATARHTTGLGRHLMAVPGPVTSGLSAGAHRLIRSEATLVSSAAEIIELVGEIGELADPGPEPLVPRDLLAPRAARVLEALPAEGSLGLTEIARGACAGEEEARARLVELCALGFVERVGEHWRLPPGSTRHARVVLAGKAHGGT